MVKQIRLEQENNQDKQDHAKVYFYLFILSFILLLVYMLKMFQFIDLVK
jgi:hypothetical protein